MIATEAGSFSGRAAAALGDPSLQRALGNMRAGFVDRRARAIAALPEWEGLREAGRAIKDHTLAHLDLYLEAFEANVVAAGGQVHWAETGADAREAVLAICRSHNARTVTKGKSMVSEEIGLNEALEAAGLKVLETDLGEYIIQLRHETPSHIIAPATHVLQHQVEADFRAAHTALAPDRPLAQVHQLVDEARQVLRPVYAAAEIGITGANFLVAETGSSIIVTNEGNGDLTQTLAKVHVVLASIEKLVPTFEDAATLLRLLARSATGQEFSAYTTVSTGPRRVGDLDGPDEYHVVLVDNGRSAMLGTGFQEMLRCIRCAACINHCPVYEAIGGHAYGSVYPGPMGSVLTPALTGIERSRDLPSASTLCGKCASVCPVKIPLPTMLRDWREEDWRRHLPPTASRYGMKLWSWVASRPLLYGLLTRMAIRVLALFGRNGRFRQLPLMGAWTDTRDFPAPEGATFQSQWAAAQRLRYRD